MSRRFLPYLVLLFAFLFFFRDLPGRTFILRDAFNLFAPEGRYLAEQYRHGYFPLWNPSSYLGLPFLAQMIHAGLYPLTWLNLAWPFSFSYPFYIALHYLLAGVSMFWWLQRLKLAPAASVLGGLALMESGYLVSMQGTINYLVSLAWLPVAMLSFDRFLERNTLGRLGLTAAVFTVPGLVGDPLAAGIWLWLGLVLLPARNARRLFASRTPALFLGVVWLSALLFSVQFWPTLELLPWSERAHGYTFDEITQWSFHPLRLLEWIFPQLFGYAWPENRFWASDLVFGANAPWAMSTYLGLVAIPAVILAWLPPRSPLARNSLLLALLFLLLAAGRYTPLYRLFLSLPGMDSFRFPEKFLAPLTFLFCTLAAIGAERIFSSPPQTKSRRAAFLPLIICLLAAAAGLLGYLLREPAAGWLHATLRTRGGEIMPVRLLAQTLGQSFRHTLGVSLALVWIFSAARFFPRLKNHGLGLVVLVAWLDLHTAHRPLLALAPSRFFQTPPAAAQLLLQAEPDSPETFRIHRDPLITFPIPSPLSPETSVWLYSRRWEYETLLPNLALNSGLADALGYTPARPEWVGFFSRTDLRRLWDLASVRYLLWGIEHASPLMPADLQNLEEVQRLPDLNLLIFRNPEALPRAYGVSGVRWAKNRPAALRAITEADLSRQVVLLGAGQDSTGESLIPARLTSTGVQRLEFTVSLDQPGYFVLADSYFPGWQARVNGAPARILPANLLVRAVAIPSGPCRVEFLYRPWGFRLGLWLSLATWSCLLLAAAHSFWKRKQPPNRKARANCPGW